MLDKNNILGIGITNATKEEVLEYIVDSVTTGAKQYFVVTPNPEILVYAVHHKDFANTLGSAEIALPDGVGVTLAASILGKPLKERIAGVDLVKSLCEKCAEKPITVGFLGAKRGIALKASERLQQEYPSLKVVFVHEGNPDENTAKLLQAFGKDEKTYKSDELGKTNGEKEMGKDATFLASSDKLPLNSSKDIKIDILFVAFGHPKQETWIATYLHTLPVGVAMAVGGSLDYISGAVPRAPKLMRSIGLEWLFRLSVQPWRIKRQLALLEFIWLVLKEKLSS